MEDRATASSGTRRRPGIGGAVGFAAAPVRVLRGSVMVRPSPRRLSPRNKHEIGALSAGFAIGQWQDHRVFIVVRPRDGGRGGHDPIGTRLAEFFPTITTALAAGRRRL